MLAPAKQRRKVMKKRKQKTKPTIKLQKRAAKLQKTAAPPAKPSAGASAAKTGQRTAARSVAKLAGKKNDEKKRAPDRDLVAASASKVKEHKRKKKWKLVHDRFAMPENDFDLIGTLKKKCFVAGFMVKKNDLLRAGLRLLNRMEARELAVMLQALEPAKKKRSR
jgi:hypothetical protein